MNKWDIMTRGGKGRDKLRYIERYTNEGCVPAAGSSPNSENPVNTVVESADQAGCNCKITCTKEK